MTSQEFAAWLALLGVLMTLLVTVINNRKINDLNQQTNIYIQEQKSLGQLRMAAIDRRLQAHQEAFLKWSELLSAAFDGDFHKAYQEFYAWWRNNCLYLEPEVQSAFLDTINAANRAYHLKETNNDPEYFVKILEESQKFSDVLFRTIKLPSLSENNSKALMRPPKA